jgi:hypothetical protein
MMQVYTHAVLKHDDTGGCLSESRNAQNQFVAIFLDVDKEGRGRRAGKYQMMERAHGEQQQKMFSGRFSGAKWPHFLAGANISWMGLGFLSCHK